MNHTVVIGTAKHKAIVVDNKLCSNEKISCWIKAQRSLFECIFIWEGNFWSFQKLSSNDSCISSWSELYGLSCHVFFRPELAPKRGSAVRRAIPDCSKIEMVSSERKYVMTNLLILSTELSEFNLATNRSSCEFKPERSFAMNFMKSFCGGFGRSESQFARESSSEPNPL